MATTFTAPTTTCPKCQSLNIWWSRHSDMGLITSECSCYDCEYTSEYDEDGELISCSSATITEEDLELLLSDTEDEPVTDRQLQTGFVYPTTTCPNCGSDQIWWSRYAGFYGDLVSECSCNNCNADSRFDASGKLTKTAIVPEMTDDELDKLFSDVFSNPATYTTR
jgi:DNA-directed RNA polymerase subunit M/transcription elongation factor TFIIS